MTDINDDGTGTVRCDTLSFNPVLWAFLRCASDLSALLSKTDRTVRVREDVNVQQDREEEEASRPPTQGVSGPRAQAVAV